MFFITLPMMHILVFQWNDNIQELSSCSRNTDVEYAMGDVYIHDDAKNYTYMNSYWILRADHNINELIPCRGTWRENTRRRAVVHLTIKDWDWCNCGFSEYRLKINTCGDDFWFGKTILPKNPRVWSCNGKNPSKFWCHGSLSHWNIR